MPVYNGWEFLHEAIQSIINQTYMNLVLIIVNDGSTEPEIKELLSKYESYSEVIIKHLDKNQGVANALNIGLQLASEDPSVQYVARMDADDISLPDRIQIQVDFMQLNENVDVCGTALQIFGEDK